MRRALMIGVILAAGGCGGGSGTPTNPVPTPMPTPTPTPTPNPYAASCGTPLPPLEYSYGYKVKVQSEPSKAKKILTASPQIKDTAYCTAVAMPGIFCATRPETDPTRPSCDHYFSGTSDTGRPGPNWYQLIQGKWLRCPGAGVTGDAPTCQLKDTNQYDLDIYAGGIYKACAGAGTSQTCGSCLIDDSTFGKQHSNTGGLCQLYDGSQGR